MRELHKVRDSVVRVQSFIQTESYLTRFHKRPSIVNNSMSIEATAEIEPFVDFSPLYTQSTHVEIRIDTFLPAEVSAMRDS